ncbi:MAG TPA: bifunctional DNA-formamidopyrimidine glycosylase/DNA-(apurinic or apyrimidinic site) lyase [Magnetospirillaceae bacterium]
MPELPEVETIRRHLEVAMLGRTIKAARTHRADLRRPFPPELAARIKGRRIEKLDRRAKYLVIVLEDGLDLLIHLGMSGRILIGPAEGKPGKHEHFTIDLDDGRRVSLHDPRRFGVVDLVLSAERERHPSLRDIGPEPLSKAFTGAVLHAALKGSATSIKAALLDQTRVAGLGNIYVCEALFRSGISPKRPAGKVDLERATKLAAAIKQVLQDALKAGGSTLRDHRLPSGELGYFQYNFDVYDREGLDCRNGHGKTLIKRIVQGGRSTFFCAVCQK